MSKNVRHISLLGLVSLPLIAIVVAVIAFGWGFTSSQSTQANAGVPTVNFRVKAGSSDCAPTAKPTKCTVATGGTFSLSAAVNNFPTGGYISMATDIDWTGSGLTYNSQAAATEITWPDKNGLNTKAVPSATRVQHGDLSQGLGATPSTFKGNIVVLSFTCSAAASTNVVTLRPYDAATAPSSSELQAPDQTIFPVTDVITINCQAPPPTRTPTPVPPTPTVTLTPTSAPNPEMCKVVIAAIPNSNVCNSSVGGVAANLANLFLTRQGVKIPPNTCLQGTNKVTLAEVISIPVGGGPNPKTPTLVRTAELGGFSFQVKFDPLKVCVVLRPGPAFSVSPSQICTIADSVTQPTLQGIATIHCVTLGKTTTVDTTSLTNRVLALIDVRPQPNVFNQIKPGQENGQIVQITDEGCKLTDVQGLAFSVFSCKSAEITLRFLEGDVEPDCQINTLDTQSIAFRWGAVKGSLIFNDRFNLMPNPPLVDQIIDINDLQFVFGRFGSTCTNPWPAQPALNGKQ